MPLDSPTLNRLLERHLSRPFAHYLDRLRNRVRDVNDMIDTPAALDQYPGRVIPMAYTRVFGPLPLTTARRFSTGTGFEKLATLASTSAYSVPRSPGNIKVDMRGPFRWMETNVTTYINWTWSTDPQTLGVNTGHKQTFTTIADIFDNVVQANGGALRMDCNMFIPYDSSSQAAADQPNVSFELALYDKLRQRLMHDDAKMPASAFMGQNFANRMNPETVSWGPNSEIEPRLYVDEIRIRDALDTDAIFNACQFRAWVFMSFMGVIEQEMPK